jgi:hypothetical protein
MVLAEAALTNANVTTILSSAKHRKGVFSILMEYLHQ